MPVLLLPRTGRLADLNTLALTQIVVANAVSDCLFTHLLQTACAVRAPDRSEFISAAAAKRDRAKKNGGDGTEA
ncbi:MAG: hypothetical protein ACJAYU_001540 [Bradymonadia bacterium]